MWLGREVFWWDGKYCSTVTRLTITSHTFLSSISVLCGRDGKYCGTVTTTSYGFSLGKQICLGFVQDLGDDNSPEVCL